MYVCKHAVMHVCFSMDGWLAGWLAGWMDGWMDGMYCLYWMYCMYACMHVHMYITNLPIFLSAYDLASELAISIGLLRRQIS